MTYRAEKEKAAAERRAAKQARNAQIVARILAGEKRGMLAEEYDLDPHTIGEIAHRAGIKPFARFKRQANNEKGTTWHADSKSSNPTPTFAPSLTAG